MGGFGRKGVVCGLLALTLVSGCGNTIPENLEARLGKPIGTLVGDTGNPHTEYGFGITVRNRNYPVLVTPGRKPLAELAREHRKGRRVILKHPIEVGDIDGEVIHYLVASHDVSYPN